MPPVCEGEYMGMYIGCDWICISALWGGMGVHTTI